MKIKTFKKEHKKKNDHDTIQREKVNIKKNEDSREKGKKKKGIGREGEKKRGERARPRGNPEKNKVKQVRQIRE